MSIVFTAAELAQTNLTIWISSTHLQFGKLHYDAKTASHKESYSDWVRFHKPPQNQTDPIEFIIKSAVRLLDGVRGPLKLPEGYLFNDFKIVLANLREELKSLRDDPEALFKEVLLDTPFLKIRQAPQITYFFTEKNIATNESKTNSVVFDNLGEVIRWLDQREKSGSVFTKALKTHLGKTGVVFENAELRISSLIVNAKEL